MTLISEELDNALDKLIVANKALNIKATIEEKSANKAYIDGLHEKINEILRNNKGKREIWTNHPEFTCKPL